MKDHVQIEECKSRKIMNTTLAHLSVRKKLGETSLQTHFCQVSNLYAIRTIPPLYAIHTSAISL